VARSALCGSWAGALQNATTTAWSGPSRPVSRYRASALPDRGMECWLMLCIPENIFLLVP